MGESDSDYSFTASDSPMSRLPTLRIQNGSKAVLSFDCNYLGRGFIDLRNPSTEYVAFKVRTTATSSYLVRPSLGVIPPKAQRRIRLEYVHTEPLEEVAKRDPHEYLPLMSKDKFMIQSMIVDDSKCPPRDVWTECKDHIRSQVLTVEFIYRRDMIHERRQSAASRYTSTSSFDYPSSSHFPSYVLPELSQRFIADRQETISTDASVQRHRFRKSASVVTTPGGGAALHPLDLSGERGRLSRPPASAADRRAISHRPSPIAELPSGLLVSNCETSSPRAKDRPIGGVDKRASTFELSSATSSDPESCLLSRAGLTLSRKSEEQVSGRLDCSS